MPIVERIIELDVTTCDTRFVLHPGKRCQDGSMKGGFPVRQGVELLVEKWPWLEYT